MTTERRSGEWRHSHTEGDAAAGNNSVSLCARSEAAQRQQRQQHNANRTADTATLAPTHTLHFIVMPSLPVVVGILLVLSLASVQQHTATGTNEGARSRDEQQLTKQTQCSAGEIPLCVASGDSCCRHTAVWFSLPPTRLMRWHGCARMERTSPALPPPPPSGWMPFSPPRRLLTAVPLCRVRSFKVYPALDLEQ